MVMTFMLSIWVLAGMEGNTTTEGPKDLGVEDSSKRGGCKEYFNSNHVAHSRRSADNEWFFVYCSKCFVFFRIIFFLLLK